MTKGTENIIQTGAGQRGSIYINDTDTYEAKDFKFGNSTVYNFSLIHCLTDVQFYKLDDSLRSTLSGDITAVGTTIPQGALLGGNYTKVSLRAGSEIIIYV